MSSLWIAFLHRPTLQLPFAVAMQGAALMVAGALFFLSRRTWSGRVAEDAAGGAWGWLGAFAWLRAAGVVVPVMLSQVTPGLAQEGFRAAYFFPAAAGWACLLEFGRRRAEAGRPERWIWAWPAGAALWAGAAGNWEAWAWWLGWGLALPAAGLAALALARAGEARARRARVVLTGGLLALAALEMAGPRAVDLYQGYSVHRITEVHTEFGFLREAEKAWRPVVVARDSVELADRVLAGWGALAAAAWAGAWWWACYREVSAREAGGGVARRLLWLLPLAMVVLVGGGFEMVRRTIRATREEMTERRFDQLRAQAAAVDEHLGREAARAETLEAFAAWTRERGLGEGFGRVYVWREYEGRRDVRWADPGGPGLPGAPVERALTEFEVKMEEVRRPYMLRPHREGGELVAAWHHPLAATWDGSWLWLGVRQDGVGYFRAMVLPRAFAVVVVFMLGVLGMLFYLHTIRREEELALRLGRARAEASDRAKTELLARVSHELRTPLQGVLGYAELLERTGLEREQAELAGALRGQGTLLLRLVNDLLDYGALQTGTLRLREEVFAPAETAEAAWATVRPMAEQKRLECATRGAGSWPRWARGDGVRLRQVLVNLLGNAVKFTPPGGRVELLLSAEGDRLRIEVVDTGPGVAPADEARIFEPLQRGRGEPEGVEGAGLGLPMARSLCVAMGGSLRLERRDGAGAVFVAEVRVGASAGPGVVTAGEAARRGGTARALPARVLVAEDNGLLRRLLELQLAELGCAVRAVADGDEAVEAWRAERPDAVLLDLAMPRMGGLEAARRIRAEAGAAGVPWIVGLSAHASARDREAGLGAGMNRFLAKPADLAALAAALGREAANEVAAPNGKPVTETMTDGLSERLRAGFCAETPALLAALSVAAARGDGAEAAKRAHYLRSSALVLGDAALEAACRRCEEAARAGEAVELRASAEGVAREARRLLV